MTDSGPFTAKHTSVFFFFFTFGGDSLVLARRLGFFALGRVRGWGLISAGRIRRNTFKLGEVVDSDGLAGVNEGEGRGGRVSGASSREKGWIVVATAAASNRERDEGTKGVLRALR